MKIGVLGTGLVAQAVAGKLAATKLLGEFGWTDILDLGDISTARGIEMYLPLWLRLFGAVGSPMVSIKVVRQAQSRLPTAPRSHTAEIH